MSDMDNHDDQTQIAITSGTKVAHYRIVGKIGAGGMGEVYLAEDTKLDRNVALKFLPVHLAQNEDFRKRFTREAQAAAKLDHPNIVPVYEVGEFQGRPYFAMAHIEGKPLKDIIDEGKLTVSEAVELTKQICAGLQKAHDTGVVHRDIKPGNIIIDNDGRPRIVDFGLATVAGDDKLTKTGSTLGTVGYMSPEQVEGKEADHRSDLFSVGVILYEIIAGRRPFEGNNDAAVVRAITSADPEPIARFKSGTTGELQQIVDRSLVKDPGMRYQSAAGMLADLRRLEFASTPVKKSRLGVWIALAAVILVAGFFAVTQFAPSSSSSTSKWNKSIAVLVFHDFSPNQDQGFFCEGMTDAIIGRLSSIDSLKVISLTSVLQFKERDRDLRKIGNELGVETILEGSIMRADDKVRIRAQLIDVDEDAHLWSQQYDREVNDVFAVQDDISTQIVNVMRIQLAGDKTISLEGRGTENIEAFNLYVLSRHLWRTRIEANIWSSIEHLERAVELDPNYVLAHAALADSWNIIAGYSDEIDYPEAIPKAKAAAERALELDDRCAEAYAALALYYSAERDYNKSEENFLRAIQLNPGYSWAHLWYANLLLNLNRVEERTQQLELTLDLDPLSIPALNNLARHKEQTEDYETAEKLFRRLVNAAPDNARFRTFFADFLSRREKHQASLTEYDEAIRANVKYWDAYYRKAAALENSGYTQEAEAVWTQAIRNNPDGIDAQKMHSLYLRQQHEDYRSAADVLLEALQIDSTDISAHNYLAYNYADLDMPDSALNAANTAVRLADEKAAYLDTKAEVASQLGLLDTAIAAYLECQLANPASFARSNRGIHLARISVLNREFDRADSIYDEMIAHETEYVRIWGHVFKAEQLTSIGQFREALKSLDEIAADDPADISPENVQPFLRKLQFGYIIYQDFLRDTTAHMELARFGREWVTGSASADTFPHWRPGAAAGMAVALAQCGDFEAAEVWLDTIAAETDSAQQASNQWYNSAEGYIDFYRGDYAAAAEKLYLEEIWKQGAIALIESGEPSKAVELLESKDLYRYLRWDNGWLCDVAYKHYLLGRAYEANGQKANAISEYETFLDLWKDGDSDLPSILDAKQRLASLR